MLALRFFLSRYGLTKMVSLTMAVVFIVFTAAPAMGQAGGTITNGTSTSPFIVPAFLFEPEVPLSSLKGIPIWNEIEQLVDNPYAVIVDPTTPGNDQGFPSYRTNPAAGFVRRVSPGVTLPQLLVHPLNYNTTTGEEMRLLNPNYAGGTFNNTSTCLCDPTGTFPDVPACTVPGTFVDSAGNILSGLVCTPAASTITVSAGTPRVDETSIDYNSPFRRDTPVCIQLVENPEGAILCGGDPGEPGNPPFGSPATTARYSAAAVPGVASPGTTIPATARLRDPAGCAERNAISPGSCTGGNTGPSAGTIVRLQKPTVRATPNGQPNYLQNTDPTNVVASNENDYVRGNTFAQRQDGRAAAIRLGKALFWDMQVGSDSVQSCGSCHFVAGADNRTKNQLNPNHLNNDHIINLNNPTSDPLIGFNSEVTAADFPLHKLADPEIAGDPACTTPIVANVTAVAAAGLYTNAPPSLTPTVCDAANMVSDVNDIMSSMGVHFGKFYDIPAIGTFLASGSGATAVNVLPPDLRSPIAADNIDPIAGFAGLSGNDLRRVEPRNTPTIFASAFNFDNFWDGRARHDFNGGSVFGASDPQNHVFVGPITGPLTATRQIIRFVSLASLATGPGLSEFEMSFSGRNWAKVAKKLLQGTLTPSATSVTPLANQLVATDDGVLGPYSNQGGSQCAVLGRATAAGKPGLCTTYQEMIQSAFNQQLWQNTSEHLSGCYTDGRADIHPNQCAAGSVAIPVLSGGVVVDSAADPFDNYVLTPAAGAAVASDTNQFTQMEANFSLFWGLSIHLWGTILVADNTPFDQFLDNNPEAFISMGEPGEPALVPDLPSCSQNGNVRPCFTEVGNFKRDAGIIGNPGLPNQFTSVGNHVAGTTDPLLGLDIFFSSNLSLKNPNFRTGRCGECHAPPTLTDNTMPFTSKIQLRDFIPEFLSPGVARPIEPLGRLRVISGFLLESEIIENGQDQVERRIINQSIVPNPTDGLSYPDGLLNPLGTFNPDGRIVDARYFGAGQSFFDNGVYNLGVRPIVEDIGRGGTDAFGWPLSLATLMLKNLGGPAQEPGTPLATFDPSLGVTGGLYFETTQDQQINPGFETDPINPLLPLYLTPWAKSGTNGDAHPELDEAGGAPGGMVNTLTNIPIIEGFLDTLGPFNPAAVIPEALNAGDSALMGTWPVVNRVGRNGSMKAPQLREVELTGPYFHNGGKLTLRQVIDFYVRGGDFPITNAAHRDFNMVNMKIDVQSNLTEDEETALIDFLLELTDDRVKFERAPFDHPEVFVPLEGTAPDNGSLAGLVNGGREGFVNNTTGDCGGVVGAGPCFRQIPAVGTAGGPALPAFLGLSNTRLTGVAAGGPGATAATAPLCLPVATSQYCH